MLSTVLKLPEEIQQDIATKAKALRRSKKISQKELSNRSGVSFGSIKRFEISGKISLDSLLKIALVLDSLAPFEQLFMPDTSLPKSLDELMKKSDL